MKPDHDVLKRVAKVFGAGEQSALDIKEICGLAGLSYDETTLFHLTILNDEGLLVRQDGKPGIGIQHDLEGNAIVSLMKLRLSADGYKFLSASEKPEYLKKMKSFAGPLSLETIKEFLRFSIKISTEKFF